MKTTNLHAVLWLALIALFPVQQDRYNPSDDASVMSTSPVLKGTWQMTAQQPQDGNEMQPVNFTMVKIFGDRHFALVYYNEQDPADFTSAGGTYEFKGNKLVERLDYGTMDGAAGSTFTYQCEVNGSTYHQSGVMPGMGENGGDYIIEEDYQKIEAGIGEAKDQPDVVGVWKLDKAAYGEAREAAPPPGGEQALKFITPGHFYVVQYNSQSRKMNGFVFGSWEIKDGKYVETIKATSRGAELLGRSIPYTFAAGKKSFVQDGRVNTANFPNYKIEEHFTRVE
jgi:hypothetical protein